MANIWGCARLAIGILLGTAAIITGAAQNPEGYTGPTPCRSNPSVLGYSNTTVLTYDMLTMAVDVANGVAEPRQLYSFVLCPNTTFRMDEEIGVGSSEEDAMHPFEENSEQAMAPIVPFLDNSLFMCGEKGEASGCIIEGGFHHVLFEDDIVVNNVIFSGITFAESRMISVVAWGHPYSEVAFINCEWKSNVGGSTVVDLFWHRELQFGVEPSNRRRSLRSMISPWLGREIERLKRVPKPHTARHLQAMGSYPAMYAIFLGCFFQSNIVGTAVIFNQGGQLELAGCTFVDNEAVVLVVNTAGAVLSMYNKTLFHNNHVHSPVFVDSSSQFSRNEGSSGDSNFPNKHSSQPYKAAFCEGIFVETTSTNCLLDGSQCHGDCCHFSDESCLSMHVNSPLTSSWWKQPRFVGEKHGCDTNCIVLAVIVPILVVLLLVIALVFGRRQQPEILNISEVDDESTVAESEVEETEDNAQDTCNSQD